MPSTSEPRVFFTRSRCGVPWFLWAVALSAFAWPAAFVTLAGGVICSIFVDERFGVRCAGELVELWKKRGRGQWIRVVQLEAATAVTVAVAREQVSVSTHAGTFRVRFRTVWESRRAAAALTRALRADGLRVDGGDSSVVAHVRSTLDTRAPRAQWASLGFGIAAALVLWLAAGPVGFLAVVISLAALVLRLLAVATTGSPAR